ncbi:hypothetical protein Lpar_0434 [Legionella parisiensis]|uniref:Uncharacterized protein n=1 Tax=Legionella parisiensis TaxID=45071 RepID=A0A1E5JN09_9GAMM|nr:hypothetical protein Lpar_0434 [Legionella parisiensis]OEH45894.1 hypothetical protein lpari_03082 [Legionella parisiensis]STX71974.1 Uncharacterised protein [Legionella parisiensis]
MQMFFSMLVNFASLFPIVLILVLYDLFASILTINIQDNELKIIRKVNALRNNNPICVKYNRNLQIDEQLNGRIY